MKRSEVAAAQLLVALAKDSSKLPSAVVEASKVPLDSPKLNHVSSKTAAKAAPSKAERKRTKKPESLAGLTSRRTNVRTAHEARAERREQNAAQGGAATTQDGSLLTRTEPKVKYGVQKRKTFRKGSSSRINPVKKDRDV